MLFNSRKSYRIISLFVLTSSLVLSSGCATSKQESVHREGQKKYVRILHDYEHFVTYYYLSPDENKLVGFIRSGLIANMFDGKSYESMVHFYAAAINNSKNKTALLKRVEKVKQNTEKQRKIVNAIITKAKNFQSPPATSAKNFDMLWAEFFATGNSLPVQKIADYLKIAKCDDVKKTTYLNVALWSLASNARQHQRVKEILNQMYKNAKGIQKQRLHMILKDPSLY